MDGLGITGNVRAWLVKSAFIDNGVFVIRRHLFG
jgi:hypothetical protein